MVGKIIRSPGPFAGSSDDAVRKWNRISVFPAGGFLNPDRVFYLSGEILEASDVRDDLRARFYAVCDKKFSVLSGGDSHNPLAVFLREEDHLFLLFEPDRMAVPFTDVRHFSARDDHRERAPGEIPLDGFGDTEGHERLDPGAVFGPFRFQGVHLPHDDHVALANQLIGLDCFRLAMEEQWEEECGRAGKDQRTDKTREMIHRGRLLNECD